MTFGENKKISLEDIEKVSGGYTIDDNLSSDNTVAIVIDSDDDLSTLEKGPEAIIASIKASLPSIYTISANDEAKITAFVNEYKNQIVMGSIIYLTLNNPNYADKINSITM